MTSHHKKLSLILQVVFSLLPFVYYPVLFFSVNKPARADLPTEELFTEDFSSVTAPDFGNKFTSEGDNNFWGTVDSNGTNYLWTDYLNTPYLSNANSSLVSSSMDLSGKAAELSFNISCDTELRDSDWKDYLTISGFDGLAWNEIARYDETSLGNEDYHNEIVQLSSFANTDFKFKLTWITDNANNDHLGCALWPIQINATSLAPPPVADTTPPEPQISVPEDEKNTTSKIVSLSLGFTDQSSEISMRLSNDSRSWSNWLPFEENYQWDVTSEEYGGNSNFGEKTIYVQLKDAAENVSSATSTTISYEDSIINGTANTTVNTPAITTQNNPSVPAAKVPKRAAIEAEPVLQVLAEIDKNLFQDPSETEKVSPPTAEQKVKKDSLPESTKIPLSVAIFAFPLSIYFKSYRKLSKKNKELNPETELDREILAVEKSTTTTFDVSENAHNYCCRWEWYYDWHLNPGRFRLHFVILVFYSLLVITKIMFY